MKTLRKIKPLFNRVVTTMNVYEEDQKKGAIIEKTKGTIKEYQTVIAVGNTVTSVKEGDLVCINPTRYMITKHNDKSLKNGVIGDNVTVGYRFNTIHLDGRECLMLYDQDIDFIIEKMDEGK